MEQILTEGLAALGIEASSAQIQAMAEYGRLLLEANEITNLTAITEPEAVARLHFLDSAALLGAGLPGGEAVLIQRKTASSGVTVALALEDWSVSFE